jgi:hypothetical protein
LLIFWLFSGCSIEFIEEQGASCEKQIQSCNSPELLNTIRETGGKQAVDRHTKICYTRYEDCIVGR